MQQSRKRDSCMKPPHRVRRKEIPSLARSITSITSRQFGRERRRLFGRSSSRDNIDHFRNKNLPSSRPLEAVPPTSSAGNKVFVTCQTQGGRLTPKAQTLAYALDSCVVRFTPNSCSYAISWLIVKSRLCLPAEPGEITVTFLLWNASENVFCGRSQLEACPINDKQAFALFIFLFQWGISVGNSLLLDCRCTDHVNAVSELTKVFRCVLKIRPPELPLWSYSHKRCDCCFNSFKTVEHSLEYLKLSVFKVLIRRGQRVWNDVVILVAAK